MKDPESVVVMPRANFFAKRKKDGAIGDGFSESVWEAFRAKYPDAHIVVVVPPDASKLIPALEKLRIEFLVIDLTNLLDTTTRMRAILLEHGVRLKANADREISYLNVTRFVVEGQVILVGPNAHEEQGIEVDKEPTLEELARRRESRSRWS